MIPAGWSKKAIGDFLIEYREKSTTQDQFEVLTSSRTGLIPQSDYYSGGRINARDNVGFHIVPPGHATYRSRSDDGNFYFNLNDLGLTGIVSHFYPVFKFKDGDVEFFVELLNYHRSQIGTRSVGSSQKVLSLNALRQIQLPVPPLKERHRIIDIFKTWDHAIEKVEALIANARAQKQALMQQLLPQDTTPPRKRLPGFSGEWKRAALGEIGTISSAGVDKKIVEGETKVRLLNFLDAYKREFIYDAELDHVVTAPKAKVQGCSINKGDVFFTPSSETRDDIALAAVAAEDMPGVVYSYHVVRFRPTKKLDLNFSAFLFQTDDFKRQAYRLGDGSGQRYVISQSNFRKMQVSLPDVAEQAAIGSLLAEHSASIAEYETQLTALRQEKAALMQQLLTGKRRVKLPESEVA